MSKAREVAALDFLKTRQNRLNSRNAQNPFGAAVKHELVS